MNHLGSDRPPGDSAQRPSAERRLRWLSLVLALLLSASQPARGQTSWEYSPYSILVWLVATPEAAIPPGYEQQFARELNALLERAEGAAWALEISPPPASLAAAQGIDASLLSVEVIEAADPTALRHDKLVFLTLAAAGNRFSARAQELDCRTRLLGPATERQAGQLADLPRRAASAIQAAFAAVVRIESGAGNSLVVRLRAGGLITGTNSSASLVTGDILQPIIRQNDRVGNPLRIQTVAWTFLRITGRDSTNPNLLQSQVYSGFRSPIRGQVASTREQYGLAIRPTHASTEVVLEAKVRRGTAPYPLAGVQVYLRDPEIEPERDPSGRGPRFLGTTDRKGTIRIPAGEKPLQIAYAKSGNQFLARLPIVAGLHAQLRASVPDDDARLEAEGQVKGFNSRLTDLVAQRQIMAAKIRQLLQEGQVERAKQLYEQFAQLPTRGDMQRQLDQRRDRQRAAADQLVQSRIEQLYADSRRALSRYLDPSLGSALSREVSAAAERR